MIIDLILNRKDGQNLTGNTKGGMVETSGKYNSKQFYNNLMDYYNIFPDIVEPIVEAMDNGTEKEVKRELFKYVVDNDYGFEVCGYVVSVDWLKD